MVARLPNAGGGSWGLLSRSGTQATAGRKGLGLQRRVRVDLGGDQAMRLLQLEGAQSGRAPGRPELKHLNIWFELWLTACLLISPCRPRGVKVTEPARPSSARPLSVPLLRAQGRPLWSGAGLSQDRPSSLGVAGLPRAQPPAFAVIRSRCLWCCCSCLRSRGRVGGSCLLVVGPVLSAVRPEPSGELGCPGAQGGSPGAGVPPVCSLRPASSCPPPHSPSASWGLASAARP